MANPEHVEIVCQGAAAITQWRRQQPRERLDLNGADLSGRDLTRLDLSEAMLLAADLQAADLFRADLWESVLGGADLRRSILLGANLTGATLHGADLREARIGLTGFGNNDLSGVRGLTQLRHEAPSSIGLDTLIASFRGAGNRLNPELIAFFRGAGVPGELLDALPKIVSDIRYYTCFISYGQPEVKFASTLTEDLRHRGASCWFYPHDKTAGAHTWRDIAAARRAADKMIVVCSIAALIRDGVLKEIEEQVAEDPNKLIPISLDHLWNERGFRVQRGDCDLKPPLMERNRVDFSGWDSDASCYDKALEDLLRGLRRPAAKKTRPKKG